MTPPIIPQVPEATPATAKSDQLEILKFLREESEANRKAQRDESDANRKLFLDTSKVVAIPLAVILTLSGIFFFHDVNTMKEAMKTQGEESARVEIQKMDKHIDETLDAQFKTDAIKGTIQQAALVATREQAPGLIKEVITPEVKKAVEGQSGTIREVATRAATDEVKGVIEPVIADVKLQATVQRANSDDSKMFDELLELRRVTSGSQEDLVVSTIDNLERHSQEGTTTAGNYNGCTNPFGTAYQAKITSPLASVRKAAIGDCISYMGTGQWDPKIPGEAVSAFTVIETITPMWVKVAFDDPSLSVRAEAITGINWLLKGGPGVPPTNFDLLDTTFLKQWWGKNSVNQAAIALIAFAYGKAPNISQPDKRLDQIGLYNEVQRLAKMSPQPLASEVQLLRDRMRSAASEMPSPSELDRTLATECGEAAQNTGTLLKSFLDTPELERVNGYGLLDLQYLLTACSVHGALVSQIAQYGTVTRSMSIRYTAVKIVNKSEGLSLDPYETKPVAEWLKSSNVSQ